MPVAREHRPCRLGEREQVVVCVGRPALGRGRGGRRRVGDDERGTREQRAEVGGCGGAGRAPGARIASARSSSASSSSDTTSSNPPASSARESVPASHVARAGGYSGRIENRAHSAPGASRLVLCLDGERDGLVFRQVVALPEPVEQVEAELASQHLLDHLAVALPRPRAAHLDGAEDLRVDRQRRARLRRLGITASSAADRRALQAAAAKVSGVESKESSRSSTSSRRRSVFSDSTLRQARASASDASG